MVYKAIVSLKKLPKSDFHPSSPPKKIFLGFMSLRGDLSQEADDPLQGKAIVDSLPMDWNRTTKG